MELTHLVITCGGTGGHFYPGLTIAREQLAQGRKVLLLLSGINSATQSAIAAKYQIPCCVLPKMPSLHSPGKFFLGLIGGTFKSLRELRRFRAQALLGMGSFASLPAVIGAKLCGIPVFLHDGNARIGKANRVISSISRYLYAAFPPVNAATIKCPWQVTGMPVRPELRRCHGIGKAECIEKLNQLYNSELRADLPTILVFGGSQGAAVFNDCFPQAFCRIAEPTFQVLHLAGKNKLAETSAIYRHAAFPVLALEASERMELFFGACDLVISRSGGSSIAEITIFGRPAILIPYPFAAEGHQKDNADFLVSRNAAVAIANQELTVERAEGLTRDFLENREIWRERGKNAAKLAKPEAAEAILDSISAQLSGQAKKVRP